MDTYVITLTTEDGDFLRYTYHGNYIPYSLLDSLALRHKANHIKCHIVNQGQYIEKNYNWE